MYRQFFNFFVLLFLLAACNNFKKSDIDTAENSNFKIDTIIDFTTVDVYPVFSECENYAEDSDQKECFRSTISQLLTDELSQYEVTVKKRVNGTTWIDILIDQKGKTQLVNVNSPPNIEEQIPKLDSIVNQCVNALPSIKPAVKRGLFVRSQYRMAIEVRTI